MKPVLMIARNNLHLTKKAIQSTHDAGVVPHVINNASTDGTAAWLKTKGFPVINLMNQHSLAACWNLGLSYIWRNCYEPVLVINNDVELAPNTWDGLYKAMDRHEADFLTGVGVKRYNLAVIPQHTKFSPHPDFACFMISKRTFTKVGPFDENFYPAYFEDNDYHVRMVAAGMVAGAVDIPFMHHGSQTLQNADPEEKKLIEAGFERCKQRFQSKWGCIPGTPEYEKLTSSAS